MRRLLPEFSAWFLEWLGIRNRPNVSKLWVWDEEEDRLRYLQWNEVAGKWEMRG